ncbi:MAG: hypothetical protein ABI203_07155, partial [Mucilaginibacter sp.]
MDGKSIHEIATKRKRLKEKIYEVQCISRNGYEVNAPGTLILNIHALRTPTQAVLEEVFTIEPYVKVEELFSVNGENR